MGSLLTLMCHRYRCSLSSGYLCYLCRTEVVNGVGQTSAVDWWTLGILIWEVRCGVGMPECSHYSVLCGVPGISHGIVMMYPTACWSVTYGYHRVLVVFCLALLPVSSGRAWGPFNGATRFLFVPRRC